MKHKNIIVSAVMILFFLSLSLLAWFKPQDTFSQSERRKLSQRPELNFQSIMNGKYMKDFEDYTLDQFPMRDEFRALKAQVAFNVLRRMDNNDIYISDGYAVKMEYPLNESSVKRAGQRFSHVYEKYLKDSGAKVYVSIIPDKNYFTAGKDRLSLDYDKLISDFKAETEFGQYIDIFDCLQIDDYYRTDTHWRQEKILPVAERLAQAMGTELNTEFEEKTLERDFYGVYYGQSALPLESEKINYLTNEILENAKVYDFQNNREISIYDMKKAEGKDPYEMFLSGPLSLITLENEESDSGKELIIFRDSFTSSLAPLLLSGYDKITLVDIRYIHPDMVGKYVDFTDSDVLFLYSASVLNNSETIK